MTSMNVINLITAQSYQDDGFLAADNYLGDFPGLSESLFDEGYQPQLIDVGGFINLCEETATDLIETTHTEASISPTECVIIWMAILLAKLDEVQFKCVGRRYNRSQKWQPPNESGLVPGIIARAIENLGGNATDGLYLYPTLIAPAQGGNAPIPNFLAHRAINPTNRISWSPAAYLAANPLPAGAPAIVFNLPDLGGWTGAASAARRYVRWTGRVKAFYRTWSQGIPAKNVTRQAPMAWMMLVSQNDLNLPSSVRSIASASTAQYAESFLYRFTTPFSVESTLLRFTTPVVDAPDANADAAAVQVWQAQQLAATGDSPYRRLVTAPFVTQEIAGRTGKIGSILSREIRINNVI